MCIFMEVTVMCADKFDTWHFPSDKSKEVYEMVVPTQHVSLGS